MNIIQLLEQFHKNNIQLLVLFYLYQNERSFWHIQQLCIRHRCKEVQPLNSPLHYSVITTSVLVYHIVQKYVHDKPQCTSRFLLASNVGLVCDTPVGTMRVLQHYCICSSFFHKEASGKPHSTLNGTPTQKYPQRYYVIVQFETYSWSK